MRVKHRRILLILCAVLAGWYMATAVTIARETKRHTTGKEGDVIKFVSHNRGKSNQHNKKTNSQKKNDGAAGLAPLWEGGKTVKAGGMFNNEELTNSPEDAELERKALEKLKNRDEMFGLDLVTESNAPGDDATNAAHIPDATERVELGEGNTAAPIVDTDHDDEKKDEQQHQQQQAASAGCVGAGMRVLSTQQTTLWHHHNPGTAPSHFDYAANKYLFLYEVCVPHDPDTDSSEFIAKGVLPACGPIDELLYEQQHSTSSEQKREPRPLLVDVGAGVGICSVEAAALGYRVMAIDPISENVELIERSAKINDLSNRLSVHQGIVWHTSANGDDDQQDKHRVFVDDATRTAVTPRNVSGSTLQTNPEWSNSTFHVFEVDTVQLDSAIGNETVGLLRFNVHGAELQALQSASKLASEGRIKAVRGVLNPTLMDVVGDSPVEFLSLLHHFGFNIYVFDWYPTRNVRAVWLQPSMFKPFVAHAVEEGLSVSFNATLSPDWKERVSGNFSALLADVESKLAGGGHGDESGWQSVLQSWRSYAAGLLGWEESA